jgi:hypothetical protein
MTTRILLTALAVLAATAAPAAAADDQPCLAPYTEPQFGTVQKCPLFMPGRGYVPVHRFQNGSPVEVGRLVQAGTANWFVCQDETPDGITPARYQDADHPQYANKWWARTLSDDDEWGWVNEIYFSGGGNDEPDGGLRRCDPPAPPPPPPPPAPAPVPGGGSVEMDAALRCTPPGEPIAVGLDVRRQRGRGRPRVLKVVFFVRRGGLGRRTDRKRPYRTKVGVDLPAGSSGRVYARVYYRRPGSRKVKTRTVSRRFNLCA